MGNGNSTEDGPAAPSGADLTVKRKKVKVRRRKHKDEEKKLPPDYDELSDEDVTSIGDPSVRKLESMCTDCEWIHLRHAEFPDDAAFLASLDITDFRYLVFGCGLARARITEFLRKNIEIPHHLMAEILRYIRVTNDRRLLRKIAPSKIPEIVVFVLQRAPQYSPIIPEDLGVYADTELYPEIVYQILQVDWAAFGKEDAWDEFFDLFMAGGDLFPMFLAEHLLGSPNNSPDQLRQLVDGFMEFHSRELTLLWNTILGFEGGNAFEDCPQLFRAIVAAVEPTRANRAYLTQIFESELMTADTFALACNEYLPGGGHGPTTANINWIKAELLTVLAENEAIPCREIVRHYSQWVPIMIGVARRRDIDQNILTKTLLVYPNANGGFNDVIVAALEAHAENIVFNKSILKALMKKITVEGDPLIGIALAQCPGFFEHAKTVRELIDVADCATKSIMARQPQLCQDLRDVLLTDRDPDVVAGVLKIESRLKVLARLHEADPRYLRALARNPHLPEYIRRKCVGAQGPAAFHIWRSFALRPDLTLAEVGHLLETYELDVCWNLARNPDAPLNPGVMRALGSFAMVPPDEVRRWLPCLRKMVSQTNAPCEEALCDMLPSYQSGVRLLLLEHWDVAEEIVYEWAGDPDFAVTLGIITHCRHLSRRIVDELLSSRANANLLEDKLVALVVRCAEEANARAAAANQASGVGLPPPSYEEAELFGDEREHSDDGDLERDDEDGVVRETAEERADRLGRLPMAIDSTLVGILKSGIPSVAVTLLVLMPGGADVAALAQNNTVTIGDSAAVDSVSAAFSSPYLVTAAVREIFAQHPEREDIMLGCVSVLTRVVQSDAYEADQRLRTAADNVLLDICTSDTVSVTVIDRAIDAASSSVLYHIMNSHVNDDSLWSIFLRELTTFGPGGPALKKIAARDELPVDLRWALALLQHSAAEDAPENVLLHVMLQTDNAISPNLLQYFVRYEPRELGYLLSSSLLGPNELLYIRDNAMGNPDVAAHFDEFVDAVSSLAGTTVTLDDVDFSLLNSKLVNDAIRYASTGIELRLLPAFLTECLGLSVSTHEMSSLLKAMLLLFPSWEDAVDVAAGDMEGKDYVGGVMNYAHGPEEPAEPAEPVDEWADMFENDDDDNDNTGGDEAGAGAGAGGASLPVTSLSEAEAHFAVIVLSCEVSQFLAPFLREGFLDYMPEGKTFILVPDSFSSLFGSEFQSAINAKVGDFLSVLLSQDVWDRRGEFDYDSFVAFVDAAKNGRTTVALLRDIMAKLEFADSSKAFELVCALADAGAGDVVVHDLPWLLSEMSSIAASLIGTEAEQLEPAAAVESSVGLFLDDAAVYGLPYGAAYRLATALPGACRAGDVVRLLDVLPSDGRDETSVQARVDEFAFVLELMDNTDAASLLDAVVRALRTKKLGLTETGELVFTPTGEGTAQLGLHTLLENVWEAVVDAAKLMATAAKTVIGSIREANDGCWATLQVNSLSLAEAQGFGYVTLSNLVAAHGVLTADPPAGDEVKVLALSEWLSRLADLTSLTLVYAKGAKMRPCRYPDALLRMAEFVPAAKLRDAVVPTDLLPLVEEVEFAIASAEKVWTSSLEPLSEMEDAQTALEAAQSEVSGGRGYLFLDLDLSNPSESLTDRHAANYAARVQSLRELTRRAEVHLLAEPDFDTVERVDTHESEPIPGLFMMQHPLELDDNLMPVVNEDGSLARDTEGRKQNLPVMRVVRVTKEVPGRKVHERSAGGLGFDAAADAVPVFHTEVLANRLGEWEASLDAALARTYTLISKPALLEAAERFSAVLDDGLSISLPRGYRYLLVPSRAVFGMKIQALQVRAGEVSTDVVDCLTSFAVSQRPTLGQELSLYLSMLSDLPGAAIPGFSEAEVEGRLAEAAAAVGLLGSEVCNHNFLRDTQFLRNLPSVLDTIAPAIFALERVRGCGVILAAYPTYDYGNGIAFVSARYDPVTSEWSYFYHLNPNACAFEDYYELSRLAPPMDIGRGMTYESVHAAGLTRVLLMSFSSQSIDVQRATLNAESLAALRAGNVHDESRLGKPLNLGRVNWCRKTVGAVQSHHFRCEAALCNASPLWELTRVERSEGTTLRFEDVSPAAMLARLGEIESE